jgi:hypothetical protein
MNWESLRPDGFDCIFFGKPVATFLENAPTPRLRVDILAAEENAGRQKKPPREGRFRFSLRKEQ